MIEIAFSLAIIGFALVAIMLAASVLLYALGKGLFGRSPPALTGRAAIAGSPRDLPAGRAWLCTALFMAVGFCALLPHLGVILVAFSKDWYATVLPRASPPIA